MLMFVFGAGASYDSDPARPAKRHDPMLDDFRPPLAKSLFDPQSRLGRDAVAAFDRAAPILLRLRAATAAGSDVERALERLQAQGDRYPGTATQLLALRAYLARLMTDLPTAWHQQCQGLTNYVLALDEAAKWNAVINEGAVPVACVSFNYDTLLENAVRSVFGTTFSDNVDDYTADSRIHVYKPHGSVNWRQAATWTRNAHYMGDAALHEAIDCAPELSWTEQFFVRSDDQYQDPGDPTTTWLPALSIPVQRKVDFAMPAAHHAALAKTLSRVTKVIAVGWRAREHHFLRLLMDHLPSERCQLVAVAENDAAATETVDNLWRTGRFDRYAKSIDGFTAFVQPPASSTQRLRGDALRLHDVLTQGWGRWTNREPGDGVIPAYPDDEDGDAPYVP